MICKDVFLLLGFNLSTTSIGVVATVIILYLSTKLNATIRCFILDPN